MSKSNESNANASEPTSASAHRQPATEAEYLAQQADDARAAIQHTLANMAGDVGQAVDPRSWTRQYPKASLGSAAVLGFALAVAVTPRKDESLKKKWRDMVDALSEKLQRGETPSTGEPAAPTSPPKPSILSKLGGPALDLLKGAITASLTAAVAAQTQPQGNGQEAIPTPYSPL